MIKSDYIKRLLEVEEDLYKVTMALGKIRADLALEMISEEKPVNSTCNEQPN